MSRHTPEALAGPLQLLVRGALSAGSALLALLGRSRLQRHQRHDDVQRAPRHEAQQPRSALDLWGLNFPQLWTGWQPSSECAARGGLSGTPSCPGTCLKTGNGGVLLQPERWEQSAISQKSRFLNNRCADGVQQGSLLVGLPRFRVCCRQPLHLSPFAHQQSSAVSFWRRRLH